MVSLFRIDLERAIKSKSPYICLGILIVCLFFSGFMLLVVLDPELRNSALDLGMEITANDQFDFSFLSKKPFLEVLHQMFLNGGGLHIFLCMIATLFVCNDFESGFVKNIFSFEQKRWKYLISKLVLLQLICVIYLCIIVAALFLFSNMTQMKFASSDLIDYFKFIFVLCMINSGFCAQSLAIAMVTRSKAVGIAAAILLPGGIFVSLLEPLCNLFHFSLLKWTLYGTLKTIPFPLTPSHILPPIVIGAAWTIIWLIISMIFIQKRDIA